MKKLVMMCLVVSLVSVASAELVQNHDFSGVDETPWAHMGYAGWGGSWVDLTEDYFRTGGWGDGISYSNSALWQDTGAFFQPNTVYTLEVEWRDGVGSAAGTFDNIQLVLIQIDGAELWTDAATSLSGPNVGGLTWQTSTLVLDTAVTTSVVGDRIGVGARNMDLVGGAWMDINSVSLVPEPATMALLGLGGLMLRKRRKA
jgi:hypothetical protein